MLTTILFDLDSTLLPMDTDRFMKLYFQGLCAKCAPFGYQPKPLSDAVWQGTAQMAANNGTRTNHAVFWQAFADRMGPGIAALEPELVRFYEDEFHAVRAATGPNPAAAKLVRALRQKGFGVVLATNPVFPRSAVRTRLSWIGLDDTDFDHLTSYENSHYCKPNPGYYREIADTIGAAPENCLMVGNHAVEDASALKAGMAFYLVTDEVLGADKADITAFERGSFAQCCEKLLALPAPGPAGQPQ